MGQNRAMQSVVVTGVSTGIGRACVEVLTSRGFHVFGSVRRDEDVSALERAFGERVTPLRFDVTDGAAIRAAADVVAARLNGAVLAGLVNNAGMPVAGPLMHLPLDDLRRQLEVNVIGQVAVIQAFLPLLGAVNPPPAAPGRIVNMSSVSGRNGSPLLAPYVASKFALEGLSESLRRELMIYGIDVVVIGPGAIATPIWQKADAMDTRPYAGTDYASAIDTARELLIPSGAGGLPARSVAELVHLALTHPRPKVRYALSPNPLTLWLWQRLPKRLADRLVARRLGLVPLGRGERAETDSPPV